MNQTSINPFLLLPLLLRFLRLQRVIKSLFIGRKLICWVNYSLDLGIVTLVTLLIWRVNVSIYKLKLTSARLDNLKMVCYRDSYHGLGDSSDLTVQHRGTPGLSCDLGAVLGQEYDLFRPWRG